jgi:glycine cleavage system aminomethyltransferase T
MATIWGLQYDSMAVKRTQTHRLGVRFSTRVATYLEELARLGIHGTTAPEVAKKLVENEVERLVREGFLALPGEKPTPRSSVRDRRR